MNKKLEEILERHIMECIACRTNIASNDNIAQPLRYCHYFYEVKQAFAAGQSTANPAVAEAINKTFIAGEQKGRQEVLAEMRKFSKELSCDETCKNNPHSCEMERRMMRAFDIIEEKFSASPQTKNGVK